MNLRLIAKLLGALLLLQGFFVGLCWGFSLVDNAVWNEKTSHALLYTFIICILVGRGLLALGHDSKAVKSFGEWMVVKFFGFSKTEEISKREALTVVGVGWLIAGAFGALPYLFSDPGLSFPDAVFESISGFTTTGSTVMNDIESFPRSILLWRSMTQWLGGVGILVLFVALLSAIGVGGKSLFSNESSFQRMDSLFGRAHEMALMLTYAYLSLSLICFMGLKGLGMTWFDALNHAMTTVSTGGFSPHNMSIGFYNDWETASEIQLWLSLFMIICSLNFLLVIILTYGVFKDRKVILGRLWDGLKNKVFKKPAGEGVKRYRFSHYWKRIAKEEEAIWHLSIVGICATLFTLGIQLSSGFTTTLGTDICEAIFMVAAISSTTGFGLSDYSQWPLFCQILLVFLMLVGGCAGATAGGMKTGRFKTCVKMGLDEIVKTFRPNLVSKITLNGNPIDARSRRSILIFAFIFTAVFIGSAFVFSLLEMGRGHSLETSFGAILATFPNIGPGFGELGPNDNFSELRGVTKLFLSLVMIVGRLELFAIMIFFSPSFWKRY